MRAIRPRTRFNPRALTAAPFAAVALLVLAGCSSDDGQALTTRAVSRGDVREIVDAPGVVQPRAASTINAPANGTVATLGVADGQDVQAGQVLMTIDSPQAVSNLAQAKRADADAAKASSSGTSSAQSPGQLAAQQRKARADSEARFDEAEAQARAIADPAAQAAALAALRSSRTQYELLQSQTQALVDQVNSGLGNVDTAVSSLNQAQRLQTRAAIAAAQATVDALTVKAPISGKVSLAAAAGSSGSAALPAGAESLLAQSGVTLPGGTSGGSGAAGAPVLTQGAVVSSGSTLLSIIDASVLSLSADVDETDVLSIAPGTTADVSIDAVQGARYHATVTSVDPTAASTSAGSVTYTVRLSYDGGTASDGSPAPTPLPGMSSIVSLVVKDAPGVLEVPTSAVVRAGSAGGSKSSDTVWVVRDGVAHRQDVAIGVRGEESVEVTHGLAQGETVVVEGAGDVSEGQQVS
ncbi:MAG: efflux RND transporter periplasmic adaptor subunit [Janthinobacterium lividum]